MKNNKFNWLIIFIVLIATAIVVIGTKTSNKERLPAIVTASGTPPDLRQIQEQLERLYPTAEYDLSLIPDVTKQNERTVKNSRYDKPGIIGIVKKIPKADGEQYFINFDSIPLNEVPVSESNTIVVAEILDKRAFVSNNKKGIYSEFNAKIIDVFKTDNPNLSLNSQITFDRDGGFVRYSNGNRVLYRVMPFGMPQIGHLYVLFLSKRGESSNYYLLTAYELNQGRIINLDSFPQFERYSEMSNQDSLVKTIREKVRNQSSNLPQ